jgi:dihydroorotate dehydrogenase
MYQWCRPFLFMLPPEVAHAVTLNALKWLPQVCFGPPLKEIQPIQAMGLSFPHRVGLAAGLDKNGCYVDALRKLSFAFIEVGTVTPLPQAGNSKPRLFRLPEARALINRMGFNNRGVVALVNSLQLQRGQGIVGINIGKNKQTSLDNAIHDYRFCLEQVYPVADYITVNLSSPNTADLRLLQQEAYMSDLMAGLVTTQHQLAEQHTRWVPLVVKCSPDESDETIKRFAQIALKFGIQGIIATNTTTQRPGLKPIGGAQEAGGLSGRPVFAAATHALRVLKAEVGQQITLIAAGGIEDEFTADQKLSAGATLLQVYTGLIYEGPGLVRRLI